MQCNSCGANNPEWAKFCSECGRKFADVCPACGLKLSTVVKYCPGCGVRLIPEAPPPSARQARGTGLFPAVSASENPQGTAVIGERKYVTVLFSDLSGYSDLYERVDAEEVREIIGRIFSEVAKVVGKYDGFIEKYVGDAVMAVFGVPTAFEDDPIRAIQAGREIHQVVHALSPPYEPRIGRPLAMHSGINTGMVVTGEIDFREGSHGISGETVNVAARLCSLGSQGEILVGPETYRQARGFFDFDALKPHRLHGKTDPIEVFRLTSPVKRPRKLHRIHGLRATLVGRKVEMGLLLEAVEKLKAGQGSIFSIIGNAGTGKSRIMEEFKATLDLDQVQWLDAQCYPYSRNIPYFPLITLLNRGLQIEEGDSADQVEKKIVDGFQNLVEKSMDVIPYVGRLYNIDSPQVKGLSPEQWKQQLKKAVQTILFAFAERAPTVICVEDIHWADPSTLELIRFLLLDFRYPLIFVCVYRPTLTLFGSHHLSTLGRTYQEVSLQDLSPSETQDMLESLLKSRQIPPELKQFIQEKIDGNPFYMEEVVNSLIESEILAFENDGWVLKRPIAECDVSPTIRGVIAARLDRLDSSMKRILQEAAVIGRVFYYDILKRITSMRENIDYFLSGLEHLDLIRTRSFQPEVEYIFKHALTQEVVYRGLLKKDRMAIHERIGRVMEQLFQDRLPELYEALAFHFQRSPSHVKAVDYLTESGQKALEKYALAEAHRYFKTAYDTLNGMPVLSRTEEQLLLDVLNRWAFVYYYRGYYHDLIELFTKHRDLAEKLADKDRLGMWHAWLGCAMWHREKFREAHSHLSEALRLGEESGNNHVVGYACCWLTWTCTELGYMDEALQYAERAQTVCQSSDVDSYIFFNSLAGKGYVLWHLGEKRGTREVGQKLLDFGRSHSDNRSIVMGYCCIGWSHLVDGDLGEAVACFQKAGSLSVDPWYAVFPKLALCYGNMINGQFQDAQIQLNEISKFSREHGAEFIGMPAEFFQGVLLIANGQIRKGVAVLEERLNAWQAEGCKLRYAACGNILAAIYAGISQRTLTWKWDAIVKNLGVFAKEVPFAGQKASSYFETFISASQEIGAKAILGQAYLNWGLLHKAKGHTDHAGTCFSKAIQLFEQCEATRYHQLAVQALGSVK
jgi:class 3 adenylate cyclase/tetratricopeptide (TPR) repeat protein